MLDSLSPPLATTPAPSACRPARPDAPPLDPAAIEDFQRQGFLAISGLVGAADVEALRAVAIDLFTRRAGFAEGSYVDLSGRDAREGKDGLPQILDPRSLAPTLLRGRFHARATALARQLLGPQARFKTDHILLKPARDGAPTPWHQDDAFRDPRLETTELSIWLPLQPVDAQNGCLAFVPGTHRLDIQTHRPVGGDRRAHGLECIAGFDPQDAVACPLPIGGCTVHTGHTVHGAGPNQSDAPRYAYVLVFELPPRPASVARRFAWLEDRDTEAARRRRRWMRRGGLLVHIGRRLRQLRLIGPAALAGRVGRKLRFAMSPASRRPPRH